MFGLRGVVRGGELLGGICVVDSRKLTVQRRWEWGDGSSRRERADTFSETFEVDSQGDEVLYLQK